MNGFAVFAFALVVIFCFSVLTGDVAYYALFWGKVA